MNRLRFLIVGSGWRSLFYIRIAKALPERFEVCAMLCRTKEKADLMHEKHQIPVSTSIEECRQLKPDFVVVAVTKASISEVTGFWAESGFPVLCETPAALKLEDLRRLWTLRSKKGLKLQVAEQYLHYPTLASRLAVVKSSLLGEPSYMALSLAHGCHGASIIRNFLNTAFETVRIQGKSYPVTVVETDSRWGPVSDGALTTRSRDRLTFEFESGKTAFYDFCNIQYHSFIRSSHLNIQGPCGELDDFTVRYLAGNQGPLCQKLDIRSGKKEGSIETVLLQGQAVYQNPFPGSGLPEDETALAALMDGMEAFIQNGIEPYPLAEALQDAYLALLMDEALSQPGIVIESEIQPWAGKELSRKAYRTGGV